MIEWKNIDTVLLDMDGTLLDLHFDNYFWREHVPIRYSEKHQISLEKAKDELYPRFQKVEGTMEWYCIDYWTDKLGLDIALLKEEVDHLIAVHPYVVDFLDAVREAGKRVLLVTNAHGKSLSLKMDRTRLGGHFDELVCAHDLGLPKEEVAFWGKLKEAQPFERDSTVLVDDSLAVLKSAREYGIKYLLAVLQPDTKGELRDVKDFQAIRWFKEIMPVE
jgi:putative hydrolase of the HAD superfamily